jgi:hypothetical protein
MRTSRFLSALLALTALLLTAVVRQTFASWNLISGWLDRLDSLRRAA